MPFQQGNTLGKGRPKGSSRIEICRKFAEEEGFERLIQLAKGRTAEGKKAGWAAPDSKNPGRLIWVGPSEELSFEALKLAIAYGFGKPTESVDISSGGATLFEWLGEHFHNGNGSHPSTPLSGTHS